MPRYLAYIVIAAVSTVSSLAMADTTYETVDAIESASTNIIRVTGIVAGEAAPTTRSYTLSSNSASSDTGVRCDRLALLAMSKPGKFQLVMVGSSPSFASCKLVLRTP